MKSVPGFISSHKHVCEIQSSPTFLPSSRECLDVKMSLTDILASEVSVLSSVVWWEDAHDVSNFRSLLSCEGD